MHNGSRRRQVGLALGLALALSFGAAAASAQGGIAAAPDKTQGATKQPDTGQAHSVTGPSTTSVAPKKTHKAIAKAKAASAAVST